MALLNTGVGDTAEAGIVQVVDGAGTAVTHTGTETASHLVNHLIEIALVRHAAHDTLGHELLGIVHVALHVTVFGSVLHSLQGTHAAVGLELPAVEQDSGTGRLFHAGQQTAQHHGAAARSQSLHDVAGIADTTVGDERDVIGLEGFIHAIHGAELGHAHASNHARGADGTRPNTHFHGVGTVVSQHLRGLAGGDVANHHIHVSEMLFDLQQRVDDIAGMSMGAIEHQGIHAGLHQSLGALHGIGGDAHAGGHPQAAQLVLASVRFVLRLGDVFVCDEAQKRAVLGHHGQFLDLVLLQDVAGLIQTRVARRGDEVLLRHHLVDGLPQLLLETEIAVGDDTDELVLAVHHGNAADVVFRHDAHRVAHRLVGGDDDGRVDHAVLGPFHRGHLTSLVGNRHVLVNHADTAFAGDGNGHVGLRHRVHGGGNKRQIQHDVARETRLKADLFG